MIFNDKREGMTPKKIYQYFFYKLYTFYEKAIWRWSSDWKATLSLSVLEIWILVSVMVYYKVFTRKDLIPESRLKMVGIALVIFLSVVKYIVFYHGDRWKNYVKEFNGWPKEKNKKGTWIIWLVVLLIIANLIFSFYLMSRIDWKRNL